MKLSEAQDRVNEISAKSNELFREDKLTMKQIHGFVKELNPLWERFPLLHGKEHFYMLRDALLSKKEATK